MPTHHSKTSLALFIPLAVLALSSSCSSGSTAASEGGDGGAAASAGQSSDAATPPGVSSTDDAALDDASPSVPADGASLAESGLADAAPDASSAGDSASGAADSAAGADTSPPPVTFVRVAGRSFVFPGESPGGFVGVNSAGLPHYGTPLLPYSTSAQIDQQLAGAQSIGARVVRVFAAGNDAAGSTQAARLGAVLDAAKSKGLYVLVSLTDFYSTSYHPVGDDGDYQTDSNGVVDLSDAWFKNDYKTYYQGWVVQVVSALRNHPALLAWELGNELKDLTDPGAFVAFATDIAGRIRAADPNHLITTGMISTRNGNLRAAGDLSTSTLAYQLASASSIDFLTTHDYRGDMTEDDTDLAAALGKPVIIEEMGYETADGDRAALTLANGGAWKQRGACAYMQWGFLATGQDNGDGDKTFGMDPVFHTDFAALGTTWTALAAQYR